MGGLGVAELVAVDRAYSGGAGQELLLFEEADRSFGVEGKPNSFSVLEGVLKFLGSGGGSPSSRSATEGVLWSRDSVSCFWLLKEFIRLDKFLVGTAFSTCTMDVDADEGATDEVNIGGSTGDTNLIDAGWTGDIDLVDAGSTGDADRTEDERDRAGDNDLDGVSKRTDGGADEGADDGEGDTALDPSADAGADAMYAVVGRNPRELIAGMSVR